MWRGAPTPLDSVEVEGTVPIQTGLETGVAAPAADMAAVWAAAPAPPMEVVVAGVSGAVDDPPVLGRASTA